MCKPLYDTLGITWNPTQVAPITNLDRFPFIIGGERGSKSFAACGIALPHIIMLPEVRSDVFYDHAGKLKFDARKDKPRSPHVVLFGPTYTEPRTEFEYLQSWLEELEQLAGGINKPSKPQDGPWVMVTKKGVVIRTWSMENPESIRAIDPEFALVCEAGQCPLDGIYRVFGRVSGTKGFIVFSGTLENAQPWYEEWAIEGRRENATGIVTYTLPAWDNLHVFPGGRNDPEILHLEKTYPDDLWAMRVAAEPRPPRFRVLKEVTEGHIRSMSIPGDALIEVWIDPGYASAYAVIFVAIWNVYEEREGEDGEVERAIKHKFFYVFDEIYEQGLVTNDIINICRRHPMWGRIRSGVIDIASKGHRDAGESALEIWKKQTSLSWNMRYWKEDRLIERIRSSAKQEQFVISPKCQGLIAECGLGPPVFDEMHPWRYPTNRDGHIISEKPIDRWNHSAKALGYGLIHHLGQVERVRRSRSYNRLRQTAIGSVA